MTYAAAVIFASSHAHLGQVLHGDDLDRSWDDWISRPEAAQAFGEDLS